jgi:hypothetical protein
MRAFHVAQSLWSAAHRSGIVSWAKKPANRVNDAKEETAVTGSVNRMDLHVFYLNRARRSNLGGVRRVTPREPEKPLKENALTRPRMRAEEPRAR